MKLTTITSEVTSDSSTETVTSKVCLFEPEFSGESKELYLSEVDNEDEDSGEDHLVITKLQSGVIIINGRTVSRRVADEIINFLK